MNARKRRKGAGRRPTGREQKARQVCLPDAIWEWISEEAAKEHVSKSRWIRDAVRTRLGRETGIWL